MKKMRYIMYIFIFFEGGWLVTQMLTLAYGGGTSNAYFVNKGTWLVKNGQKSAYVIYERPLKICKQLFEYRIIRI